MFFSYAQNYEDVMLNRALSGIVNGFYIDIGANSPEMHSVTKCFYDKGWSGINVEPMAKNHKMFLAERNRDINLNLAVSNTAGEMELWECSADLGGLATLDRNIAKEHELNGFEGEWSTVKVVTLDSIFEQANEKDVHFLKIDVEGFEKNVIEANNWQKNRPWIIVVESTLPLTQVEVHESWEYILLENDYNFVYKDGLNRFYVSKERSYLKEAFNYPPNVFDDFLKIEDFYEKIILDKTKESDRLSKEIDRLSKEIDRVKDNERLLKLNHLEADMKLKSEIDHYKGLYESVLNSWSWRITKPIRYIQLKKTLRKLFVSFSEKSKNESSCWYWLKKIAKSNPILWKKIRKFVFGYQAEVDDIGYEKIEFPLFDLYFCIDPLSDLRGIGRVTKEILNQLKAKAEGILVNSNDARKKIHFYSSIHWCPLDLPENSIVMIHDVIPLIFPDKFSDILPEWLGKYKKIANNAKRIVTISETSALDIEKYFQIPKEKIDVVYNGVTNISSNGLSIVNIPTEPYFYYIGAGDKHKNLEIVFNAFLDKRLSEIKLVLIGDNVFTRSAAKKIGVEKNIEFLGRVTDEEAAYVIKHSKGLVFPSLYEGFGLPPLEAALLGIPSICSDVSALKEFNKDSALFVNPHDSVSWADAILELVNNDLIGEKLVRNSTAKDLTWGRSVDLLILSIHKVV